MKNVIIAFAMVLSFLVTSYSQTGWFKQYSNTTNDLRDVYFINQQTGWAVGWNSAIIKTTNSGLLWSLQNLPSQELNFQSCFFVNENTGWVCGGSGYNASYIYKTTNSGTNWFLQYNAPYGILLGMQFVDSLTGFVSGYSGKILTTTNGGSAWEERSSGVSVNLTNVYFVNANTGWITGDSSIILKTTTGGAVWSPYFSGVNQNLEGIYFLSPLTGFISGYNGIIIKTTDGGLNWIPKYTGSTLWLNSISFADNNTGWVCGGAYFGYGTVLKTTNGGDNWMTQSIPVSNWLANITFVNSNYGWAVGDNGSVISTVNGGQPTPLAPVLVYPPHNSINIPVNATFRWNKSQGATNYSIHISPVPQFAVITDTAFVDTNCYSIPQGKLNNNLTYFWHVKAYNQVGASQWSSTYMFSTLTTGINTVSSEIPKSFKLHDPYPNPFNPLSKIQLEIPKSIFMKIQIFDLSGRLVERLYEGIVSAGIQEVVWNADKFNSGVFILQVSSNEYNAVKRLVLLK